MENVNWTVRNPNLQKNLKSENFFYFFPIFTVFETIKIELPTLKKETKLKMKIKNK